MNNQQILERAREIREEKKRLDSLSTQDYWKDDVTYLDLKQELKTLKENRKVGCEKILRDDSIPTRPFYKCGINLLCQKCKAEDEEFNKIYEEVGV